ncbi:1-(5-phosphoribosyl)-5-[(5-phosphoribosylamino)methylideneamino]imidazole-4-carboxamide isomerase [Enterococcus termitis]|nr:1-(5-phosphoribosyl)-5-[(5-phosphoribosylamino)methylideneamino]imidazole-4-carboxamide isomerase [Enterococcus termitis]
MVQGDFSQKTIVNEDPLAQIKEFKQAGIQMVHVVDLDGALLGETTNALLIKQMKEKTNVKIEVGGGIRTLQQIDAYAAIGIDRIIIGSTALTDPTLVKEAVSKYGDKIAVGIDAKNEKVAVRGWLDVSETDYLQLAKEMAAIGVKTIIYTDISKDGTLTGPTYEHYKQLAKAVPEMNIIASGGVASKKDLFDLAKLNLYGAIVGKAFYNGAITLIDMLEVENNAD